MIVHLIDGTYELFRHFYGIRRMQKGDPPFGAVRGVLAMVLQMIETGATHIGVATDHVIESFRNELWDGYKTGAGIDAALWAQFHPLEEALTAMGVVVWPMVELEADDALASAAALAAANPGVEKVCIWTPDKDLAQCVVAGRVVQVDRKSGKVRDADGVREKFGVSPASIPDYLALVGDTADGYPGLPGWGERSAAAVVGFYTHLETVPRSASDWKVKVRGADRLAGTLQGSFKLALLFRDLATLRTKEPRITTPEKIRWREPRPDFPSMCKRL